MTTIQPMLRGGLALTAALLVSLATVSTLAEEGAEFQSGKSAAAAEANLASSGPVQFVDYPRRYRSYSRRPYARRHAYRWPYSYNNYYYNPYPRYYRPYSYRPYRYYSGYGFTPRNYGFYGYPYSVPYYYGYGYRGGYYGIGHYGYGSGYCL